MSGFGAGSRVQLLLLLLSGAGEETVHTHMHPSPSGSDTLLRLPPPALKRSKHGIKSASKIRVQKTVPEVLVSAVLAAQEKSRFLFGAFALHLQ